jgi:hypothetical protein
MTTRSLLLSTILISVAQTSCVVRQFVNPQSLGSFRVIINTIAPAIQAKAGCEGVVDIGTKSCTRTFPIVGQATTVNLSATALDQHGEPFAWTGAAQVDVRPGQMENVGPAGLYLNFTAGQSESVDVSLIHAHGEVRLWVEDCGTQIAPGTFATGVSPAIYFESPRIDQINESLDNTGNVLEPRADNVCAIGGDPRFGVEPDEDGVMQFVGYSHGRTINAPPPPIGVFVDVGGCNRDEYNAALAVGGQCARGPVVVTGIDNAGFYVVDLHPDAIAAGFNGMYAFNFNYPDNLEVGDIVTTLRGSPVEFAGSTQFRNPYWIRDGVKRGSDLIPMPTKLDTDIYRDSLKTFGRNRSEALELEKLEGSVVCVDQVAPASTLVNCDINRSTSIERRGCLVSGSLPPRCDEFVGTAPMPPACDSNSERPFCLPLSAEEIETCKLTSYVPANPLEYCCERICYEDLACSEESSYVSFGQWVGDVYGRYEPTDSSPVKLAFITRDANPDFDPIAFGLEQRSKSAEQRQHVMVVGNLRQVLAARPVWVVVARSPSDIVIGGSCPTQP